MSNSGNDRYMSNLIPELMGKNKMSVKQLSKACQITTTQTIYGIIDATYLDAISGRVLFEISKALNCTFYDLFEVIEE